MKGINTDAILKSSKNFFMKNGTTILSVIASFGVIGTVVLAVKATPEAEEKIKADSRRNHDGDPYGYSKTEAIKSCWRFYIPTFSIGVATIACILGANALNKKQQTSLISAYALLNDEFKLYRRGAIDVYGEDADTKIKSEIAKKMYINTCGLCSCSVYDADMDKSDELLFYDFYSKRFFNATIGAVMNAEYHINRMLNFKGEIDVNTFYEFLGLDPVENGNEIGWNMDYLMYAFDSMWIDFDNQMTQMEDGMECYILSMMEEPMPFYVIEEELTR